MTQDREPMLRLRVGDVDIDYADHGEGEPILLVHAGAFGDVLVEPAPGGGLIPPNFADVAPRVRGPAHAAAAAGDVAAAFDIFTTTICGPDYREVLEAALGSDGLQQGERDSEFFFADELERGR